MQNETRKLNAWQTLTEGFWAIGYAVPGAWGDECWLVDGWTGEVVGSFVVGGWWWLGWSLGGLVFGPLAFWAVVSGSGR